MKAFFTAVLLFASTSCWAQLPEFTWKQSLPVRFGDTTTNRIGGTEARALVAFDNKLFAGIGYWMDTDESAALPGAQVLRLDGSSTEWQVDFESDERAPSGLRLYQAISNLGAVRIVNDDRGNRLSKPVELLLAGVWKRGVGLDVFVRSAGSNWSRMIIPGQESAPRGTQARSFAVHRDRTTGADVVLIGASNLIFAGAYNAAQQKIIWKSTPEWQGPFIGDPSATGRVSSFAEANGKLYAAVYNSIYERNDGRYPSWKQVFQTTVALPEVTGLRGLTAMRNPAGAGEVLLASVEDNPARIHRVDPHNVVRRMFTSTEELNVSAFLTQMLGTRATYTGIAYNNTTEYLVGTCMHRFIGLETITRDASPTVGTQRFSPNAYYLVRDCVGKYFLREVRDQTIDPKPDLVATRAITPSPFLSDPAGTVYASGYDTNGNPAHNTAWIYKGTRQ